MRLGGSAVVDPARTLQVSDLLTGCAPMRLPRFIGSRIGRPGRPMRRSGARQGRPAAVGDGRRRSRRGKNALARLRSRWRPRLGPTRGAAGGRLFAGRRARAARPARRRRPVRLWPASLSGRGPAVNPGGAAGGGGRDSAAGGADRAESCRAKPVSDGHSLRASAGVRAKLQSAAAEPAPNQREPRAANSAGSRPRCS